MQKSRALNTVRNSFVGMVGQFFTLLFSFASRTFFLYYLGAHNLGYDALFTNILSVLSIVDLGITTALTYALYSSLHERNYSKTVAVVSYFKKIFVLIGIVLLLVSILISPFVSNLVKIEGDLDIEFLRILFIMYAFNSFSTYFYVDMRTLLIADQKEYILSLLDSGTKILTKIGQICILYFFQNYILYIGIEIIFNIFSNIIICIHVYREYHIKDMMGKYKLTKNEKKRLFSNIFYLCLNKIANTGINSTDNIIISKIVGTATLGLYSNYSLIIGTGYALVDKLIIGVTASLGNLFVENDQKKQEKIIFSLQFMNSIFSSIVFIFLFIFTPQLIFLWLGKEMMLPLEVIFVVCINQYFYMVRKTLDIIMQTKGVFKEIVPIKIMEMILNLAISVVFAMKFGLVGVFVGTTISIIFSFLLVGKVLIRDTFHFAYKVYMICQLKYFIINMLCFVMIYFLLLFYKDISIFSFIFKFVVAIILFVSINYFFYRKNENYIIFKEYIDLILKRIKSMEERK